MRQYANVKGDIFRLTISPSSLVVIAYIFSDLGREFPPRGGGEFPGAMESWSPKIVAVEPGAPMIWCLEPPPPVIEDQKFPV